MKRLSIAAFVACIVILAATRVRAQSFLLTPDSTVNATIASVPIADVPLFGTSTDPEGRLVVSPRLPEKGWNWIAAREAVYSGRELTFFVYDGYIYTTEKPMGKYRPLVGADVSDQVVSNAFHVALLSEPGSPRGKDREIFLFVASDVRKEVSVTLGAKLLGRQQTMDLDLEAGEARFFRIVDTRSMSERKPLYAPPDAEFRTIVGLEDGWRFHFGETPAAVQPGFDDSQWKQVSVPHSWNATDVFDNRNVYSTVDVYSAYRRGAGWYRRTLRALEWESGQRVLLSFDGANQMADVWVNGTHVGNHAGGYTGFSFDITDHLEPVATNVIAVRVDNKYDYDMLPHIADFDMSGGITREVRLEVVPSLRVASTFVQTPRVSRNEARVRMLVSIDNARPVPAKVRLVSLVVDPDGFIVGSAESQLDVAPGASADSQHETGIIASPRLWSPRSPTLYRVITQVFEGDRLVDVHGSPLGFRWFDFDPSSGFHVNGEHEQLRGVNLHQDRFGFGPAVPDWLRVQDLQMIKEMGANFVRLAHYPHDPVVLAAADQLGLIVWAEIPFVNTVGREAFIENAKQMLREMIQRDRNHPSIAFWGIANETHSEWLAEEELVYVERTLRELNDLVKKEDPTRFSAQAQNAIADTAIIGITDVIGRNRYYGWYEEGIDNFGRKMDTEHRAHPDWRIVITEYGAGAKRGYHTENPTRFDFSESYQVVFHEGVLNQIEARPYLAGGAIWNMFDFASQNKIGSIPRINQKGMGTYDRVPKDAFYFYQSRWGEKPMVYIVSHTWTERAGRADELKTVRVFSNMDEVELSLDGESLGSRTGSLTWDVPFKAGTNRLVATGFDRLTRETVVDLLEIYYTVIDDEP